MNNKRRKEISNIIEKAKLMMDSLVETDVEELKSEIEDVLMDEENAFDNLSEGLQATTRGMMMEDAICNLNEAIDTINGIETDFEELIDLLEEAMI